MPPALCIVSRNIANGLIPSNDLSLNSFNCFFVSSMIRCYTDPSSVRQIPSCLQLIPESLSNPLACTSIIALIDFLFRLVVSFISDSFLNYILVFCGLSHKWSHTFKFQLKIVCPPSIGNQVISFLLFA